MIDERRLKKIMKFNYKKIASVFASAVMLSSTIGFAAAANYPTPFTDGSAVVYGSAAASSDITAAIDIYDQLKDRTSATTSATASVTGEAKPVETSSQPLYLGDYMNTTKQTFSKDQLPTVLASGTLTDDDGTELDYDLKVDVLNTTVEYGENPDNTDDVVYVDLNSNNYMYVMKVIFPTAANMTLLTDEPIKLFGKDYVFSGSTGDLTDSSIKLFEKSTTVMVNDGEEVVAEGHTISVAVEDANTASITIDGVTESHDEGWSGKIGGVDMYLKNVVGPNVAGTSRYVEVYLNSNKLTLTHGSEVKLGSNDISGTLVSFSNSSHKIPQIDIIVQPYEFDDQIKYIDMGDSFTDPVFGSLKFELASLTPELEDASRDTIVIKPSGEKTASIAFTNKAGKEYDLDIIRPSNHGLNSSRFGNGTDGTATGLLGTHTYNSTELGVGTDYELVTTTANVKENDYFITCSNEYTQIWKLTSVKNVTNNEVKVKDQGSGSDGVVVTLSSAAPGATGSLSLADGSTTTITMHNDSSVNVTGCAYLYTKSGAKIDLWMADYPISNESEIVIEEETAYNGGAFTDIDSAAVGKNVSVRFDYYASTQSGKDMKIRDVMGGTGVGTDGTDFWSDDIGDYDYHYLTKYGTFVKRTGDSDKTVEIFYPEDAMSVGFYIGEVASEITPGSSSSSGQIAIVKDNEVSTVKDKHLIVVGGSCINTVAAKILGSDSPVCGADFTTETQVSNGGYIIKSVASPYNEDKVAMLVAGYDAADTINAVKRAMVIDGVSTDAGKEEVYPVVS